MMNNFEIAAYAAKCHSQQKRRYTDDPYIIHPLSVASIVENAFPDNMVMMQSALLHDVIEDCGKTYHDIYEIAGLYVATIVDKFLTDQFTSKKYPNHNRKERKKMEHSKWDHPISYAMKEDASFVKLADLYDNSITIKEYDKTFWKVYVEEALDLIPHLYVDGKKHQELLDKLMLIIRS